MPHCNRETITENHNQRRVVEPSLQYVYRKIPHLRLREQWERGDRKTVRTRGPGSLCHTYKVSLTWLPKYNLNKDSNNSYDKVNEWRPCGFNPTQGTKEFWVGGIAFLWEDHSNWLSKTKWSAQKKNVQTSNIIQSQQGMFYIHMHMWM